MTSTYPNFGWWRSGAWPKTIDRDKFAEFVLTLAPTPEKRAEMADQLGIASWGYSSKRDFIACVTAIVLRDELEPKS